MTRHAHFRKRPKNAAEAALASAIRGSLQEEGYDPVPWQGPAQGPCGGACASGRRISEGLGGALCEIPACRKHMFFFLFFTISQRK